MGRRRYRPLMQRIIIRGPATAWQTFGDERESEQITDAGRLPYFDGLEYRRESLCAYMGDGEASAPLAALGLGGGFIALGYAAAQNELIAKTEYTAPRALTAQEIEALVEYTLGQWSDGVGSNFSQSMAAAVRVSIDIMLTRDEVKVEVGGM